MAIDGLAHLGGELGSGHGFPLPVKVGVFGQHVARSAGDGTFEQGVGDAFPGGRPVRDG